MVLLTTAAISRTSVDRRGHCGLIGTYSKSKQVKADMSQIGYVQCRHFGTADAMTLFAIAPAAAVQRCSVSS